MFRIFFLSFLACVAAILSNQQPSDERHDVERSLKHLFRFPSEPCTGVSSRSGTCFSHSECMRLGGSAEGDCLYPFGVCCVFLMTCNNITNADEVYFVNPTTYGIKTKITECKVAIHKNHDGICQFRLDFNRFNLPPPVLGECKHGFLGITGMDSFMKVPKLCGSNQGQHIYLSVWDTFGPVNLLITTDDLVADSKWEVKITQIGCDSPFLAPAECLQYYESVNGTISSFNFDQKQPFGWGYMNNLEYAICFKHYSSICSVTFESFPGRFKIGNGTNTLTESQCIGDYLQFPFSRSPDGKVLPSRICGSVFSSISGSRHFSSLKVSSTSPLVILFATDNIGSGARGFKIDYVMDPC